MEEVVYNNHDELNNWMKEVVDIMKEETIDIHNNHNELNNDKEVVDIMEEETIFLQIYFPGNIKHIVNISKTKTFESLLSFCCSKTKTDNVILFYDGGIRISKNMVIGELKTQTKSNLVSHYLYCEPLSIIK